MSTLDRSQAPAPARVHPFTFPEVQRSRLANGLELFTARHGTVPLATARIVLDAGVTREPAELGGVAHLVAHTIDAGTTHKDAERLSWELELLGAQLEVSTGFDATAISVTAATDRMPQALALLCEMVTEARFPEAEVKRVRTEQLGEIEQRRSDPRSLASDQAIRFMYGSESVYGRSALGSVETVQRLTVGDVRSFYHDRYAPGKAALILVGALDGAAIDTAHECLSRWSSQPAPVSAPNYGPSVTSARVHIIDRTGSVQSEIRLGHAGPSRADPDYFALQVVNSILGGAFTSRLNLNLREKQGFTYGVRSQFAFRRGPGPFIISTAVASEVTARAIEETLREVDLLSADGPTEEELQNTIDYLTGIMPLELQTTDQLAGKLSELFVYGLSDDYFATYRSRIAAVTREDALRAGRQHIKRVLFTYVVVGDPGGIEEPLKSLGIGPVEVHSANE
ncbi:MAG: pitrilysin family protein [Gemmatimonadota bacterium]